MFLPYIARINWRTCNFASQNGFQCVDSFAQYMGADYDSNGDGQIDSEALRYQQGESEADYVTRITTTLRATLRDANAHLVSAGTSYDYIQSDDTHPTYYGSATISIGLFGGGSGSGAPDYSDAQIVNGKNPHLEPLRPRADGPRDLALRSRHAELGDDVRPKGGAALRLRPLVQARKRIASRVGTPA